MWSVGISVSPCQDATKIGYDERQINRIVIRLAQYFLDQNMRVIFGHDWREDGVMRAVANFAEIVASRDATPSSRIGDEAHSAMSHEANLLRFGRLEAELSGEMSHEPDLPMAGVYQMAGPGMAWGGAATTVKRRMLNVVPTKRESLSRAVLEAQRDSGGVLGVLSLAEGILDVVELTPEAGSRYRKLSQREGRAAELTALRHCITDLLNPGCRICLGGKTSGYQGNEPGVMEEARLALRFGKPLFLMGGFGGASREFGENEECWTAYQRSKNGLPREQKRELFESTDIERAVRLISFGIECIDGESNARGVGQGVIAPGE